MSEQEFKPGDRVRISGSAFLGDYDDIVTFTDLASAVDADGLDMLRTQSAGFTATLVSRPVYPEPGQVVVALDPGDFMDFEAMRHFIVEATFPDPLWKHDVLMRFDALREKCDRAREAVKP